MILLLALIVAWRLCDLIAKIVAVHMRSPDFSLCSQQIRERVFPGLSEAEVSEAAGVSIRRSAPAVPESAAFVPEALPFSPATGIVGTLTTMHP